ncbi:hypothetical protein HA402_007033 [Bradysia odoriphaga]|nr:hypothetical protein HA402_007033 [Bradysia odoriphaga]
MEKNIELNTAEDKVEEDTKSKVELSNMPSTIHINDINQTAKLTKTPPDDVLVIKQTNMTPKVSRNTFEESAKIVGDDVSITIDGFGMITTDKGTEVVKRFTFINKSKLQVQVISLGATVTSIRFPDKNGLLEDVALGFDSIEEYFEPLNPNIGCTLGRDAFETLKDEHYSGLGLYNWIPSIDDSRLVLTHVSEDGWQGHRGTVMIKAIFELKKDNSFHVTYWATSTTPASINLSLNLFLNLAGHAAKHTELYKHIFTINSDKSIKERTYRLSKFKPLSVGGTVYDLRSPKEIGPVIARSPQYGFDKYYILTKGTEQTISFAARVIHPESGRYVEIYTDQGGIQLYTADYFPDSGSHDVIPIVPEDTSTGDTSNVLSASVSNSSLKSLLKSKGGEIKGKNGAIYHRHGSFCINSLGLPAEDIGKIFANHVLVPGRNYEHRIIYKFGTLDH